MLARCRPTFCDAGPASKQHWRSASRLLGRDVPESPSSSTSGPHQTNNSLVSRTCRVSRLSNTDPLWWAIIMPTLDRHLTSAVKYIFSVHHSSKRRRSTSAAPMRASVAGAEPTSSPVYRGVKLSHIFT